MIFLSTLYSILLTSLVGASDQMSHEKKGPWLVGLYRG